MARDGLDHVASQHGLPSDAQALRAVRETVQALQDSGSQWLIAQVQLVSERRTAAELRSRAERSGLAARELDAEAGRAASAARGLTAQLEEIEHTVGAAYEETLTRIDGMRTARRAQQSALREHTASLLTIEGRIGARTSERSAAAARRDAAVAARDAAAERFRYLLRLGFPADAGAGAEVLAGEGTKATLETARSLGALWPSVPYEPKHVADALGRLGRPSRRAARHSARGPASRWRRTTTCRCSPPPWTVYAWVPRVCSPLWPPSATAAGRRSPVTSGSCSTAR
ncbi:hypothetical protein Sfulv_52240 [Streptomyces fulvorobeus]|uniref:Uncharacterized protein n=1 Tax=Streptomyces fulvorobeus TaxID=284028 RepID=A0A7J0CET6_9ACTN|nr:hypothetical protein Sfulv_52240 [Streptomyces fulvorobeus]